MIRVTYNEQGNFATAKSVVLGLQDAYVVTIWVIHK